MSACDRRAYYPAEAGLFKLRASDGDLVWECRPVQFGATSAQGQLNTRVDMLPSGNVVVSGVSSAQRSKVLSVAQSGGLVSAVSEYGNPTETFGVEATNQQFAYDITDDYVYHGGPDTSTFAHGLVLSRFSHAGAFEGTRTIGSVGSFKAFRAIQGTEQFDVISASASALVRYPGLTGASTASLAGAIFGWDRTFRIVSDGTHYYIPQSSTVLRKITIATLAVAATRTVLFTLSEGDTRDGYVAYIGRFGGFSPVAVSAWDTATLAPQFVNAGMFAGRATGVGVCGDFVAAIGTDDGTHPGTATQASVKRLEFDGSVTWTTPLPMGADRSAAFDVHPRVLISQDKTRVYAYGPFSHNGVTAQSLKMAIYCLDADDGSIIWRFSDRAGVSLYDDGDYLYLGTITGTAPLYR